jgi:chromosome segregation ATPase
MNKDDRKKIKELQDKLSAVNGQIEEAKGSDVITDETLNAWDTAISEIHDAVEELASDLHGRSENVANTTQQEKLEEEGQAMDTVVENLETAKEKLGELLSAVVDEDVDLDDQLTEATDALDEADNGLGEYA